MTEPARSVGPAHLDPPVRPDDDRGCLRIVLALPFTLLSVIAAYFCWTAVTIRPSGSWDDDAYGGIVLSCVVTLTAMRLGGGALAAAVRAACHGLGLDRARDGPRGRGGGAVGDQRLSHACPVKPRPGQEPHFE